MGRTIILPGKDFYGEYWNSIGGSHEGAKHIKDCADILLDLRSDDGPAELGDFGTCDIKIPTELREALDKQFDPIPWAADFHDSIATTDDATTKFPTPCTNIEEAIVETAKVYQGTHRILILSENSTVRHLASSTSAGVTGFKDFAQAFKKN